MFAKRMLLAGLLALPVLGAHAQTQTLDGVSSIYRSAISPIYAGNEVKGYILYAKGDKADKKNDNYRLDFYDQDLTKVSNITLQKPAGKYFLLANSFNGSAFGLYFYNLKDKTLEMETYDTSLQKVGAKVVSELSSAENHLMQYGNRGAAGELFAVPGYGFARNKTTKDGYAVELYSDALTPKWTLATDPKVKYYESLTLEEAKGKYLIGTVKRWSGKYKGIVSFMLAIDCETGQKVLELPVEADATEHLSLTSFTFDPSKREFVAVGEYYKPKDEPFVNKSQGFYLKRFSETGQLIGAKNYAWQGDVKAVLPEAARPSVDGGFVNYTQAVVRGANGKLYIVAEQYRVFADGFSVAKGLLANSAVTKGRFGNLLIFTLDEADKLTDIKFFPKDESKAYIPSMMDLAGTGALGSYFRASGQFDYQFIQKNDANSQFNVVYINYDKEQGEQTKKIIGNVAFGDNGQFKLDRIDGTSGATASYLYPAKPGYLMLVDYLKKDKKVGMKLVKVNI